MSDHARNQACLDQMTARIRDTGKVTVSVGDLVHLVNCAQIGTAHLLELAYIADEEKARIRDLANGLREELVSRILRRRFITPKPGETVGPDDAAGVFAVVTNEIIESRYTQFLMPDTEEPADPEQDPSASH